VNNNTKFQKLLSNLENQEKEKIISILEFGSKKGLVDSEISDTDLLIITKDGLDTNEVFDEVFKLEDQVFHWPQKRLTLFIEKHFLGSNDISGIHAIVLAQQELLTGRLNKKNARYKSAMKSFRLRILTTFFICEPILLYKIKKESVLLYGIDLRPKIHLRDLNLFDRIRCFTVASMVLLFAPLSILNSVKFKIWCLKSIKYNNNCIESYIQICQDNPKLVFEDLKLSQIGQTLTKRFRYHPQEYRGSTLGLYFKSWLSLARNISFVWKGASII
jgi:hypothetical protein